MWIPASKPAATKSPGSSGLRCRRRAFGVPTILTSVIADRGGLLFRQLTDVFPGQEVIDRTFINTWQDQKVVDAVKATGRKQLIIAACGPRSALQCPQSRPPAKAGM